MNDLTVTNQSVTTQSLIFDPQTIANMQAMAEIMATARVTVPKHLAGSPGDCLAVIMQAAQWAMNPFAVAQKTHVVNGALGYEAQLVNAVVSSSALLASRINYAYEGDWSEVDGRKDASDERAVIVSATIKGERLPRALRVSMAQVGSVRNSPLWSADPRQQLAYLATKRWARLHAPDVLLGVYTQDELQDVERTMGAAEVVEDPPTATRTESVKAKLAPPVTIESVLEQIEAAQSAEELKTVGERAKKLTGDDAETARAAYKERVAEIKRLEKTFASLVSAAGSCKTVVERAEVLDVADASGLTEMQVTRIAEAFPANG